MLGTHIAVSVALTAFSAAGPGTSHPENGVSSSSLQIDATFPGGNIIVDNIEADRVFLRPDRRDTPRWWFYWYFRVRGAVGRTLTFTFTDGNPIGVRGPAISTDGGRTWSWLGAETVKEASFTYQFAGQSDEARFCFTIPYLDADLQAWLERHRDNPHIRVITLCKTPKGRDVESIHLGRLYGSGVFNK